MEDGTMKRKPIFLIPLALSLFLTGLLVAGGTMAGEPTLRITISPRSGRPGTAISVTGEGAQTDKPVKVAFVTSGEGGTSLAEVEVTPQADGTFATTINVPDEAECKTYAVRAEQTDPATGNLIHYWWNSFTVIGTAEVTPGATATVEPTATNGAPATPEATAPIVPTTEVTPTVTVEPTVTTTAEATPAATAAATPTAGGMPTTGGESSKPDNTMVMIIAILATMGVLAALGAGIQQARRP
jgi:hypothetical protein